MKRLILALAHPRDYAWLALRPWRRHSLVLAVLGTVYILIGWTYILAPGGSVRERSLQLAVNLLPFDGWGVVWIITGCLGILSSRWPPASETWGYTAMSGLAALWGSFFLGGVILGAAASGLSGALAWYMVAFLWWAISGLQNPEGR